MYGRSVNVDFHVVFEKNRYSCPYQYARKTVDLRVTDTTIEIYYKDERISTHNRFAAGRKNQYSTHPEDMPEKFKVTPWDDIRIKNWAAAIGPYTAQVINKIFNSVSIKEQAYNPSLAVLRLSRKYSDDRLETSCELALTRGVRCPRYHHLQSILASDQDKIFLESKNSARQDDPSMGYLRGSDYYD